MSPRQRVVALALVTVAAAAGCSSSSSAGGPVTGGSPAPTVNAIDRTSVDATLSGVIRGLRALTSLPSGADSATTIARLHTASSDLRNAAGSLSPIPHGVPYPTVQPVAAGLSTVASLIDDSALCLTNAGTSPTARAACADPLRNAEKTTTQLARDLIKLSAYGSEPPTTFEQSLVTALHGK